MGFSIPPALWKDYRNALGLMLSDRCYCGNQIYHSRRVPDNVCSSVCMGDFGSICGGRNVLSLYVADKSKIGVA